MGHLNFSGTHMFHVIVPQALGAAISRLSPILHWRLSPERRQEGRPAQWLCGSEPHARIMLQIVLGPPSHSAWWKNTQDPTDMTSISNTCQWKGERGLQRGRREQVFTRDLSSDLLNPPHKASGCSLPASFTILHVSLQRYKSSSCVACLDKRVRLQFLHHSCYFRHRSYQEVHVWLLRSPAKQI